MFHFPGLFLTIVRRQLIAVRFPRRISTAISGCRDLTVAFRTLLRPLLSGYPRHPSYALKQTLSSLIYVIMLSIYPLRFVIAILIFLILISSLFYTFLYLYPTYLTIHYILLQFIISNPLKSHTLILVFIFFSRVFYIS